ncbi:MAG TPA: cyclic-di-AMP receptor [Fimbriimonadaceae bacterium]|nr:cyclic-di-AMP receptor [Fimbriimonadaceae bacterium]
MKLVVCIVHNRDRNKLTEELVREGYKFTVIGSTGGFLREGNTTLLIGVEDEQVAALKSIVQKSCKAREQMVNVMPFEAAPPGAFIPSPVKVPVGGAVMFLMNVDEFVRY